MKTILTEADNRQAIIGALNMAAKCRGGLGFKAPVVGRALRTAYKGWLIIAKTRRLVFKP